jgi:hypothetical protein
MRFHIVYVFCQFLCLMSLDMACSMDTVKGGCGYSTSMLMILLIAFVLYCTVLHES